MKKTLLPLLVVASIALTGCPKKEESKPAAPAPEAPKAAAAPASASTQPVTAEVKAAVVTAAKDAVAEGQAAVTAAAAEVKTQATAAATQVTDQVKTEATTAATSAVDQVKAELAAASTSALDSAKAMLANPQVSEPMKAELTKLADSLAGGKDGASAEALAKIAALKPTGDQLTTLKEIQSNVGVLVLGRNFDQNDPASGGAVKSAIDAIKAKDTAGVVAGLQKIGTSGSLTAEQKQMATNLMTSWSPELAAKLDSATKTLDGAAKKADALKGSLKGFGL